MKQVNQRRIVPMSALMIVLFSLLGIFQLFVIAGGYELKTSTVNKIAPWAYEPFLRLVGEHPETRPVWAVVKGGDKEEPASFMTIGGFSPEEIQVTLDLDSTSSEKGLIEATVPVEEPKTIVPVTVPVTEPEVNPEDSVPVG